MTEGTKACPICGEEIKSAAWKCANCNKFISPVFPVGCSALWAIAGLLIIPIMLLGLAFMLSIFESQRQNAIEDRRATAEAAVEKDRSQETAFQTYLNAMSNLIKEGLHQTESDDPKRGIARAWTLTVLRQLDAERKGLLLRFLHESNLITYRAKVNLRGADLTEANLSRANLREADLSRAVLSRADLRGADLRGADLLGAVLSRAVLSDADLREANLSDADLSRAVLREAILAMADLRGANLSGAYLRRAVLREAHLSGADLSDADLREANLIGADLTGADLSEADLTEAVLTEAVLSGAKYDDKTIWLDGFDPEAAGAVLVSD